MNRSGFVSHVFMGVGIPSTSENIDVGIAWAAAEGSSAHNNPLDTTEPWEGATDYNSTGVKNYATTQDGIDATVATLKNGLYDGLIAILSSPNTNAQEKVNAIAGSKWGTSDLTIKIYSDVVAQRSVYDTEVAGSTPIAPVPDPDTEHQTVEQEAPNFDKLPMLKEGSTGKAVHTLTTILNNLHISGDPTNPLSIIAVGENYGPEVTAAVNEYQTQMGLKVDGEVGAETWASFFY